MLRPLAALLVAVLLMGVAPLDSQTVLTQYQAALRALETPKYSIYSYVVSQAVPTSIEQRHIVYRSGESVRDESWPVGTGRPAKHVVSVGKREDVYAIARLAPRRSSYEMLFERVSQVDGHLVYIFATIPYVKSTSGFTVTQVAIDATRFLPRALSFTTSNGVNMGHGELRYTPAGAYWVPLAASVTVLLDGKPAREHISWGDFRFPPSLPASTFRAAR